MYLLKLCILIFIGTLFSIHGHGLLNPGPNSRWWGSVIARLAKFRVTRSSPPEVVRCPPEYPDL